MSGAVAPPGLPAAKFTAPVRRAPGARAARRLALLVLAALVSLPAVATSYARETVPVQVKADYIREDRARNMLYARGSVALSYLDLVLKADEILLNLEDLDLVARGDVTLSEGGQVVTATQLTYNLRTRFGSLDVAETRWRDPLVLDPIHIRAQRLEGNINQRICLRTGEVTTCDLNDPRTPYKFTAEQIDLIPQDKVILRNTSLYLFGRKVLTLPVVVIFLRGPRQPRFLPIIGYSEPEGFFIKTTTTYFINDDNFGFVYADWMEKLGVGLGVEHMLKTARDEGNYFLYVLGNRQTAGQDYRVRLQHRRRFDAGLSAGVLLDYYRRQPGDGAFTSNLYATLDALYTDAVQNANLFTSYTGAETAQRSSDALSTRLLYTRQIAPGLTARLQLPYSQTRTDAGTDLETTPRLDLTYSGRGYSLQLVAEHRFDPDGDAYTGDRLFTVSRLPELTYSGFPQTFQLGRVRLSHQLLGGLAYFQEEVPGLEGGVARTAALRFDVQSLLTGSYAFGPRTSADLRLSARGSYYSGGEARGIFAGTLGLFHQATESLSTRLTYNYKDNAGTTPFQFDRDISRLHNAQLQITYRRPHVTAELTGGYDLLTSRASPLVLRADWLPRPNWTVAAAATYDLTTSTLATAEASLRVRLSDQWDVAYRTIYNPPTGSLLHDLIQVNYLQDCWVMSATYVGSRQEFWLEVRLTAFPQARGGIGLGQTGLLFTQPFLPAVPTR